jgi:hypothetical protein
VGERGNCVSEGNEVRNVLLILLSRRDFDSAALKRRLSERSRTDSRLRRLLEIQLQVFAVFARGQSEANVSRRIVDSFELRLASLTAQGDASARCPIPK